MFGSLICTHCLTGPGLAIRIICGDEPYQASDFAETNIILGQIVDFVTAVKKVRGKSLNNIFRVTIVSSLGNLGVKFIFFISTVKRSSECTCIVQ